MTRRPSQLTAPRLSLTTLRRRVAVRLLRRTLTALVLVMAMSVLSSPAHAATPGDAILSDLAQHVSHGFADKPLSMLELERRIANGDHVSVLCGQVSMLGQRALARAGIRSRLVGTFSSQRYEMYDVPADVLESHALLEVWDGTRWVLYDLDSNVQPVTADGQPVTITGFAQMSPRYYRSIANDPLYDPTNDDYPIYEAWLFANHEEWYDRVLDIVTVESPTGGYVYTGPRESPISGFAGYRWVDDATFARIAADGPAAAATVPAPAPATSAPTPGSSSAASGAPAPAATPSAPAPAPAAAPSAPAPIPAAPTTTGPTTPQTTNSPSAVRANRARRPCTFARRPIAMRGGVRCDNAKHVLRVYRRRGRAPRPWTCHTAKRTVCRYHRMRLSTAAIRRPVKKPIRVTP
jgi:hypothetical protein